MKLIKTIKTKYAISKIATHPNCKYIYYLEGFKNPNIIALDLASLSIAWTLRVPERLISKRMTDWQNLRNYQLYANEKSLLFIHKAGAIGNGFSSLLFLDGLHKKLNAVKIDDKITEAAYTSNMAFIGNRDGTLRNYNINGGTIWKFTVPNIDSSISSVSRNCPFYIRVDKSEQCVACSSYSDLFVLNRSGKMLWKWKVPIPDKQNHQSSFTDSIYSKYYETLGLTNNATEDDIKSAFRKMAVKTHPDLNPDKHDASGLFRKIKQAYEVLSGTSKLKEISCEKTNDKIVDNITKPQRPIITDFYLSKDLTTVYVLDSSEELHVLDNEGSVVSTHPLPGLKLLINSFDEIVAAIDERNNRNITFFTHWNINSTQLHSIINNEVRSTKAITNQNTSLSKISKIKIKTPVHGYNINDTNTLVAVWGGYPDQQVIICDTTGRKLSTHTPKEYFRHASVNGKLFVGGTNKELQIFEMD
jgi:hypothetical protein